MTIRALKGQLSLTRLAVLSGGERAVNDAVLNVIHQMAFTLWEEGLFQIVNRPNPNQDTIDFLITLRVEPPPGWEPPDKED